jgi:hypothetical protein
MNQPIKKSFDENGNKVYTGNAVPQFPNKQSRKNRLQKSTRNLMFNKDLHLWHIQTVFNKKQNKEIKILHLTKPILSINY